MSDCDKSIYDYWSCCPSTDMSRYATKTDIAELWEAIEDISISGYDDTEIWQAINEHIDDEDVHVTAADKDRWNDISALTAQIEALQATIVNLVDRMSVVEGLVAQKADGSALTAVWNALEECCSGDTPDTGDTPGHYRLSFALDNGGTFELPCDGSGLVIKDEIPYSATTASTSVTFGDCISDIGLEVFAGCYRIESFDVPSGVTRICRLGLTTEGNPELEGSLSTIYMRSSTPPTIYTEGGSIDPSLVTVTSADVDIFVPRGSETAYRTAYGWSNHASKIQPYNY